MPNGCTVTLTRAQIRKLQDLRTALGWSLEKTAGESQTSIASVSRMLNGYPITRTVAENVSLRLGLPFDQLLLIEDDAAPVEPTATQSHGCSEHCRRLEDLHIILDVSHDKATTYLKSEIAAHKKANRRLVLSLVVVTVLFVAALVYAVRIDALNRTIGLIR